MKVLLIASWVLFGLIAVWAYTSSQQAQLSAALAQNSNAAQISSLEAANADLKDQLRAEAATLKAENSKLSFQLTQKAQQADSMQQQLVAAQMAQQRAEDAQAAEAARTNALSQMQTRLPSSAPGPHLGRGIPATRDEVSELYQNGGTNFKWNAIAIQIYREGQTVSSIDYFQDTPFNELQIESMLKPLSPEESWVQADDHDWTLPLANCSAHWDGDRHLVVKSD